MESNKRKMIERFRASKMNFEMRDKFLALEKRLNNNVQHLNTDQKCPVTTVKDGRKGSRKDLSDDELLSRRVALRDNCIRLAKQLVEERALLSALDYEKNRREKESLL